MNLSGDVTLWLVAVASLFAAWTNGRLVQLGRDRYQRAFHALVTLVAMVFATVYLLAALGLVPVSLEIGATLIRPGIIVLMALLGAYAIAYMSGRPGE